MTVAPKEQGYYPYGSGDDALLDRIWVEPQTINPEHILEATNYTVKIWNAYQDTAYNWTGQVVTGSTGTTFTHAALPIALATGEDNTYTLTLDEAGPIVQSTTYTLGFSDASWHEINISSTRALLLVLEPDWKGGLEIHQEYETAAYSTECFVEQRRPQREIASSKQVLRFGAENAQAQKLLSKVLYGKDKIFAVPIYPEILHPSVVTQGSATVTLVTSPTYHWYLRRRATYVLIVDWAAEQIEVKRINSIDYLTPGITFTTAVAGLFDADALLYPVMLCEIESYHDTHHTDRADESEVTFRELLGVS